MVTEKKKPPTAKRKPSRRRNSRDGILRGMDVLSVDEAAAELDIAPRNLRTWILRGRLKAKKVGPIWLIERKDLDAFKQWWAGHARVIAGKKAHPK